MTKQTSALLLAAALAAGMPVAATAQQHQHGGGKPAAAPARPAPHFAPAPRTVAPAAPRLAAPHMATPRMAAPHMAAPRKIAPHTAAQRTGSPHVSSQRTAIQHHQSQAVNRAVQRQQFQQERSLRQQRALLQEPVRSTAEARPNLQAQKNRQTQRQLQLNTRQQLRAERALRQQEDRELRHLPASQRAQRLEEIRNTRQQRVLNRQQLAQPNALQGQSNARTVRANRLNGTPRVTQDAARQGRFAARFAERDAGINARSRWANLAARDAWRHHHRARFVAWFGPVFWPYAYSDIFDYAFWPYGYEDGYWAYAYDDFFDGLFWGEAGPPVDYAYAPPVPSTARSRYAGAPRASYAAVEEVCRQPGSGITAWPFADIERKVGLDANQKQLLGDVRKASQDAAAVFKASCPLENAFPLTPPGRLDAMTARLDATLQAVQTVRPALEKFYNSLSDEQKERFNQLGPRDTATNAQASVASRTAETCRQPKPGLVNLPSEKIEDAVNPTGGQVAKLSKLQDATNNAVSILQAACPDETPMTPPGRLDAMEKRLRAMVNAAKTVRPALEGFYASLTSEQKAQFNRIGRSLAETTGQSSN